MTKLSLTTSMWNLSFRTKNAWFENCWKRQKKSEGRWSNENYSVSDCTKRFTDIRYLYLNMNAKFQFSSRSSSKRFWSREIQFMPYLGPWPLILVWQKWLKSIFFFQVSYVQWMTSLMFLIRNVLFRIPLEISLCW